LDNGSRNSMVILPTVANIMQINVYAAAGGDNRDIKLQRWDNATSAWIDVATYSCTTKNECYFFTTNLSLVLNALIGITAFFRFVVLIFLATLAFGAAFGWST